MSGGGRLSFASLRIGGTDQCVRPYAGNPRLQPWVLPEAGAAKFLAEVCAVEADDAAHFMQAGAHALADTVS